MVKGGGFLKDYEINAETLILIPMHNRKTKVVEINDSFIVNNSTLNIIKDSCMFFGCSYEGRKDAVKNLIGVDMKVPILLEESRNIIFFPTASCVKRNSIWISYQNLLKYTKFNDFSTILYFQGKKKIKIDIKYNLIDNQVVRCLKLDTLLMKRKMVISD